MKKVLWFLVGFVTVFSLVFIGFADAKGLPKKVGQSVHTQGFTLGGGLINGHSYSSDFSIDGGYTGYLSYDRDTSWEHVDVGVMYTFGQFEIHDNIHDKDESQTNHILTGFLKPHFYIGSNLKVFAIVGAGVMVGSDDSGFVGQGSAGIDYHLFDNWSVSVATHFYVTEKQNMRTIPTTVGLRYTF